MTPPPASGGPGDRARALMRRRRSATLATAMAGAAAEPGAGWPYASLVTVACWYDASPILLLSDLSDHTRNLKADARAALLFEAASARRNPQTGPRVTVLGKIRKVSAPEAKTRFLSIHPDAALYADFKDFNIYRMRLARGHYIGGFASAHWTPGKDLKSAAPAAQALAEAQAGIVGHMNADHADAIDLYARHLLGRRGNGWRLAGVDPDGCDLVRDGRFARLAFDQPVSTPAGVREALVALAGRARERAP